MNIAGIPVVYIRPHTTGIPATSPKTRSCEKILQKTQGKKRNPQESWQERFFFIQKINS